MSEIKYNLLEVYDFIKDMYNTNKVLEERGMYKQCPIIIGDNGIGKTDVPKQFARDIGVNAGVVRLGELDELSQLVGYPLKRIEMAKIKDGKRVVRSVDIDLVSVYMEHDWIPTTKDPIMSYAVPEAISRLEEGDILILDDFSRNLGIFHNAVMGITRDYGNISWKLPKNCTIILTSNPDDGRYDVKSLDLAQKDRLVPIYARFDAPIWIQQYAQPAGIANQFIDFIYLNQELVTGGMTVPSEKAVSIRKWTDFFAVCSIQYPDYRSNMTKVLSLGDKYVGDIISNFSIFIQNDFDKIVPSEFLMNTSNSMSKVVSKLEESLKLSDKKENLIRSVITFKLANYIDKNIIRQQVGNDVRDRVIDLLYCDLLERDNIITIAETLTKDGRFNDRISKISELLSKGYDK